jgi:hypothetical protein
MGMPWEGEWRQQDGKIKLRIDEALGKAVAPGSPLTPDKIELTPLRDGSMKLSDTFIDEGASVVLKRVPSPK